MPDVIITPNLGRVDFTTGSVTPRTESIYIDPVDGLVFTGKISASAIVTSTFSSSIIYITSSQLVITDNVITLNALTPYKRYAGIEMYDSGSGTLSNFLWDGQGDYFFLSGSNVNGKVITGPDGQADLMTNYVPKVTAGYKLGNSVMYDDGARVGIATAAPSGSLTIQSNGNQLRLQTSSGPNAYYATIDALYNSTHPFSIAVAGNSVNTAEYFGIYADAGGSNPRIALLNGNVGIGITNPTQKLEVAGYVMAGEGVYRTNIYGSNGGAWIGFGDTGSLNSLGRIGAYGALFNINSLNNDISFQYNSAEKMRVTTGGHLGLGITTPTSYVNTNATYFRPSTDGLYSSVFATTEAVVNLISSGSADGAAIGGLYFTRMRAQADAHYQIAAIRAIQAGSSNSIAGGTLQFFTKINGAGTPAASPQMVILSDGNVGIGLTPATKLDVSGSISIRGTAVLQSASDVFAGGLGYDIYGNIRVLRSQSAQGDGMYIGYAGNGGPLRFFSNSGTTEFMTIATSGNVGINNTSPSRKLHVVGDIGTYKDGSNSISGHLYIANAGNTQAYNLQLNSTGTSLNLWTYDNANGWKNSVTFAKAGNVGIGTTIPSASLHINSTTSGATLLRADGTNGTLFSVVDDLSDSLLSVNNSAGLPVFEVFADDRIVAGQYGQNDLVVINNKVGIGTNNPANKLYVSGSVSIGSGTYNTSAPTNGLIVEGKVGVGTNSVDSWAQLKVIGTSALGGIVYVTDKIQALSAFPGSATNLQLNTDGGNVGIGTTLPVAKLQVNGNVSGSSFTSSISNAVGFLGTASWASNAVSSTSATSATSASYALNSTNAVSATSATSASYALTATTATTANNVNNGQLSFSSGSGISISAGTFTANQSGNTAFTISLVSNSVTVGSTAIALGGSATTIAGLTSVTSTNFTGNLIGTSSWASNATTVVTNANLTGDVTSVGNATTIANNAVTTLKIADSNVTNAKLQNSSLTIGSTAISLGGTATTITGLSSLNSTNLTASNIYASGTVGIGSTVPTSKLDIGAANLGTTGSNSSEFLKLSTSTSNLDLLYINNTRVSNGTDWQTAGYRLQQKVDSTWMGFIQFNGNNNGGIAFGTGTNTVAATNIATRMTIDGSGNVGIGTTVPGSRLEVQFPTNPATDNGAGNNVLRVWTSASYAADVGGAIGLGGTYNTASYQSFGQIAGRKTNSTVNNNAGYLQFATTNASGTMTEWMRIDNAGNVGIGSTNPGYKLDVNGSIKSTGLISNSQVSLTSGTLVSYVTPGLYLTGSSASNAIGIISNTSFANQGAIANIGLHQSSSNANDLTAKVHLTLGGWYQNSGTGIPVYIGNGYTIESSPTLAVVPADANGGGNVGIGTTSPSYKLHVNGTAYINSTLQVNSNITLSGGGDVIINDSDGTGFFASFMDNGIGYIRIDDTGSGDGKLNINNGLVYIQGAGNNVGIGTTVPGQKLDVEGRIRTRGATGTGGFEIGAATTGTAKWRIEWDSASDSLDFNWVG